VAGSERATDQLGQDQPDTFEEAEVDRPLTFGSLFAGIGGLDAGLAAAGLTPLWACEIDPEARRVLARHRPEVPCHEDIRTLDPATLPVPDLLCAGVPCQDWSVAGKRAGLAGARSGLFFKFVRLADVLAPRWLLFENVPGLLSACSCDECAERRASKRPTNSVHRGRDFATVLEALSGCRPEVPRKGWRNAGFGHGPKRGIAWRVLDAQFVGGCPLHVQERGIGPVPQRRRRLFLVAHSGDVGGLERQASGQHPSAMARLPVEVLFEPESGTGHPAPGREERPDVAAALRSRSHASGVNPPGRGGEDDSNLVTQGGVCAALTARMTRLTDEENQLIAHAPESMGADASEDGTGRGTPLVAYTISSVNSNEKESHAREGGVARCLDGMGGFAPNQGGTVIAQTVAWRGRGMEVGGDIANAIRSGGDGHTGDQMGYVLAFQERGREGGRTLETQEDVAYSLMAPQGGGRRHENNIQAGMTVRRLTPIECLRLMALPDDYLDLDPPLSDSAKYRLIGNAVVRVVARWLGQRLQQFSEKEYRGCRLSVAFPEDEPCPE
jgi:DNA (cytosine-5)-methyltransferase 1